MQKSDLERIAAFEQRFAQAQASDIVDLSWGFALLQYDFPRSHDHNRIVVNKAAPSEEILSKTDMVLGGAGLGHRYITLVDEALDRDLSHDFVAAGYERETITTMIYGGATAEPPAHAVRAVSLDVLRPALVRDWKILLPDAADEVFIQLADRTQQYTLGAEVTRLVVVEDDEIAARMDLYIDPIDRIAQLENLFTHPDYRGRGYAMSLLREALGRSHRAACELSFLAADLDDWPHEWYLRLGFADAHQACHFTRT